MPAYESLPDNRGREAGWRRRHENDEETRVAVTNIAGTFHAVALDVGTGGDILATHGIAATHTRDEALAQAGDWMQQNPKGVQPGGNSILDRLSGGD